MRTTEIHPVGCQPTFSVRASCHAGNIAQQHILDNTKNRESLNYEETTISMHHRNADNNDQRAAWRSGRRRHLHDTAIRGKQHRLSRRNGKCNSGPHTLAEERVRMERVPRATLCQPDRAGRFVNNRRGAGHQLCQGTWKTNKGRRREVPARHTLLRHMG